MIKQQSKRPTQANYSSGSSSGGLATATWDNLDQRPRPPEKGLAASFVEVPLAKFNHVDQEKVELYNLSNGGWAMVMQNGLFKGAVTYTITEYEPGRNTRVSTVLHEDIEHEGKTYKAGYVFNQRYLN